ncbi:MAG: O-GlcNAcase NagJ precursor [Verrucomicrobiota bacterium]
MRGGGDFLGGVVEGFYGRPWTQEQRFRLFDRMAAWGLNAYFYAPKDDLKHRAIWREPYDEYELDGLAGLVEASNRAGVRFIYGLSPGLDIGFSDLGDRDALLGRLGQMVEVGCLDFALLFDDLPGRLTEADWDRYGSVAAAQCDVANEALGWLRSGGVEGRFLFCPTPYCGRMVRWGLGGVDYLDVVGRELDGRIDVLWTGPEIVSGEIPVEGIRELAGRIRRKPVIWDNLHANDYDGRRVFCGPYSGRALELRGEVRGILMNPNNEFVVNYVPMRTLAEYLAADGGWDEREAYLRALGEWSVEYGTVGRDLDLRDLELLGDCYYLPYGEGESAREFLEVVGGLVRDPVESWGSRYGRFVEYNARVQALFERLTELTDRELFYAWSRRVWDLKEELQLLEGYLVAKREGRLGEGGVFCPETHLPGTYRGGVVARLQSLLLADGVGGVRGVGLE